METKAKYFPQTAAALQSLQETAAELKQAAEPFRCTKQKSGRQTFRPSSSNRRQSRAY